MKKSMIAFAIVFLTASPAVMAQAVGEGSNQLSFERFMAMADKDRNRMVTRQEFLDAMGMAYDMKMERYKAANDPKMMQGIGMTRDGVKSLLDDIYRGA